MQSLKNLRQITRTLNEMLATGSLRQQNRYMLDENIKRYSYATVRNERRLRMVFQPIPSG